VDVDGTVDVDGQAVPESKRMAEAGNWYIDA